MSNWCRLPSVYVPWMPQRFVMCSLAVVAIVVGWMVFLAGYKTYQEIIAQPYERPGIHRSYVKGRCFNSPIRTYSEAKRFVKVYWSRSVQKGVMEIFWLGYAISSIAGGLVVDPVGTRQVWGVGSIVATLALSLLPSLTKVSPFTTMACLFVYGFGFGLHVPCSSVLVAHWAPENERTIFVAFLESGILLGLIVPNVLHDNVKGIEKRWEVWLYVACVVSAVWILVWYVLFYNRPEQHPHLPHGQLIHLLSTTPGVKKIDEPRKRIPVIPWKRILLSPPFWSLQLYNLAASWVQCLLFFVMYHYFEHVFKADSMMIPSIYLKASAGGIALFSLLFHSCVSEMLISRSLTPRTENRRFFLTFSNCVSAILFPVMHLLGCSTNMVMVVFFMLIYVQAMSYSLLCANVVELSPRYAGVLRGILSGGRAISFTFCLKLSEVMICDYSDRYCWVVLFYVTSAISIVLSIPYACLGSADIQEWNDFPNKKGERGVPVEAKAESTDQSAEPPGNTDPKLQQKPGV